jgi:hypothetical protein
MMVVLMAVVLSVAAWGTNPKVSNGRVFHPAAPGFAPSLLAGVQANSPTSLTAALRVSLSSQNFDRIVELS